MSCEPLALQRVMWGLRSGTTALTPALRVCTTFAPPMSNVSYVNPGGESRHHLLLVCAGNMSCCKGMSLFICLSFMILQDELRDLYVACYFENLPQPPGREINAGGDYELDIGHVLGKWLAGCNGHQLQQGGCVTYLSSSIRYI